MKSVFVLALFLDALGCLGQIRVSKDSVAIWSWEDVTIDRARTLFGEVPKEQSTQLGHAKLVSGVCVPIEGPYILDFEESGVTMQFTPLDSLGQGKLKSPEAMQRNSCLPWQLPIPFGSRYNAKSRSSVIFSGVSVNSSVPDWEQVHTNQVELVSKLPGAPLEKQVASVSSEMLLPAPATF